MLYCLLRPKATAIVDAAAEATEAGDEAAEAGGDGDEDLDVRRHWPAQHRCYGRAACIALPPVAIRATFA